MRSRSARCWSRAAAERASLIAAAALITGAPLAHATLFVQPLNFGGALGGTPNPADLTPHFNGGTIYYAITPLAPSATAFPDTAGGYGLVDLSQTQASDPSLGRAIQLNVESNQALTPGANQIMVLEVTTTQSGGSTSTVHNIPIAAVNGTLCSVNNNCYNLNNSSVGGYSLAVPFVNGASTTIYLYPKDICAGYAMQNLGVAAGGCDPTAGNVAPGSVTPPVLMLNLSVNVIDAGTLSPIPNAQALDSGTINLNFQNAQPTFNCPDLKNIYFPGDGSILLDTSNFGNSAPSTAQAPLTGTVVLGNKGGAQADLSQAGYAKNNSVIQTVAFGTSQVVSGFTNVTSANDTVDQYNLGFMVRDASGLLQPVPNNAASCLLGPVTTSSIQGFLSKSNCFIATAAFRSIESSPVALLRAFRDRVLLRTGGGRAFVRAYYRWSPSAADWLMRHPQLRQPVLLALLPLEILAWLLLHPLWLALPFAALAGALFAAASARKGAAR